MNMSPPFHFSTHIILKSYNIHDLLFTHVFIYKRRAVCRNEPHGRSSLTHSTHDMSPQKREVLSSLTTLFGKRRKRTQPPAHEHTRVSTRMATFTDEELGRTLATMYTRVSSRMVRDMGEGRSSGVTATYTRVSSRMANLTDEELGRTPATMYTRVSGRMVTDMARGRGRTADGDVYEGEFKDGEANGRGTYTWSDGDAYEGEFKDGLKHGRGTWMNTDGTHTRVSGRIAIRTRNSDVRRRWCIRG